MRDLISIILWRRDVYVFLDSNEAVKFLERKGGFGRRAQTIKEERESGRRSARWTPDEAVGGEGWKCCTSGQPDNTETRPEVSPVAAGRGQQEASAAPQMQLESCLASQHSLSHRRDQQGNCHSSSGVAGSCRHASIAVMKPVKLCIPLGLSTAMLTWQLWKSCCLCTEAADLFCQDGRCALESFACVYCQAQISIC